MELVFLKKATSAGSRAKVRASMSNNGTVQLSKASNEVFNLNSAFKYGRIALEKIESDLNSIKTFYFVEELDQTKIESEIDIVKMVTDKSNDSRRFTFSALVPYFPVDAEANKNKKSVFFNIQKRELNGLNILQFTLHED